MRKVWPVVAVAVGMLTAACVPASSLNHTTLYPTMPGAPASIRPTRVTASVPFSLKRAIKTALDQRGIAYEVGGEDPDTGFDCSGLVHFVFAEQRADVPRTVIEQFHIGTPVARAAIRAGDLLFFTTTAKGATHVAIAIGSSRATAFVHAPGDGGVVRVDALDAPYWNERFVGARRVF